MTIQPVGLYLHLPFCEKKCSYCDFPSYAGRLYQREAYTQTLCGEIRQRARETGKLPVDTVFLGGGTPSLMKPAQLEQILGTVFDCFDVQTDAEITSEGNPGTLTRDYLDMAKNMGVNRLSLGAQSAHEGELQTLGRIHTWAQVEEAVKLARAAGFDNLNIDLMSALPGQDWKALKASLEKALALQPAHMSVYSLILEEGTPFYDLHQAGQLPLPEDEVERELYWNTAELLEKHGFHRYEISNYCKSGFECCHNLNTWRYHDYLGFGLSAAGLYRGVRQKNVNGLDEYLNGETPQMEALTAADQRFEQAMLALRLREGLSLEAFEKRQGIGVFDLWGDILHRHIKDGLLVLAGDALVLTSRGFDLMDRLLLDIFP